MYREDDENMGEIKHEFTEIEKVIETTDDWHPNYSGDRVRIFIMKSIYTPETQFQHNLVRVAVWGADDFGLELDFQGPAEESEAMFLKWKEEIYDKVPEPCTKQYFRDLGFVDA
jgi:hypothetical protein